MNGDYLLDRLAKPHFVYRFFDAAGEILYVGCTHNLHKRMVEHACEKPWWGQVAEVESTEYTNGYDAYFAEWIDHQESPGRHSRHAGLLRVVREAKVSEIAQRAAA